MMRNGRHFTSQLHQSSALFRKHISNIATQVLAFLRMSKRRTATIQKAICELMEGDTARVTYRRLWLEIELGVPNAGTCAHHPNVAGNNTTGVPQAVAMGHCTLRGRK